MKVLLINSEHALLGGAHTVYLNTADMLSNVGVEVIFFAMHSHNEISCAQEQFFPKVNSRKNVCRYVMNSFYNRVAAQNLQRLIDLEHPDIAHVHLMWGSLSPSILEVLKKNKIPVVHSVHDYAMICSRVTLKGVKGIPCEKCKGGHYFQSIITKCHNGSRIKGLVSAIEMYYRNCCHHPVDLINHFLFVTQFCSNKHQEMDTRFIGASKSVLYNVPDKYVAQMSDEPLSDTYQSYYLYYGRLAYEKGLETLISAFIERPDLKLKVVGTGPIENKIRFMCKESKASNIVFLGFKAGEELYRIVKESKFVCAPSEWYENGPMTVIEGATIGTPSIGSRIGAIPELIEDGVTGFLFDPGSKNSLIEVLLKSEALSKDEYSQMKTNAQNKAKNMFDRGRYVKQILNVYRKTINDYKL